MLTFIRCECKHCQNKDQTYSAVKKYLLPHRFILFLLFCHTCMFQIIKQILISDKDNLRKYKMQFLNDDFISREKTIQTNLALCEKVMAP